LDKKGFVTEKSSEYEVSGIAPRIRFINAINVKKPTDKCEMGKTVSQGLSKLKN
jgi:hypothetical protein